MWQNKEQIKRAQSHAIIYAGVFAFSSINLFISILLTMCTSPGQIPDSAEWQIKPTGESTESLTQYNILETQRTLEQALK